jgi:hypothetical protein
MALPQKENITVLQGATFTRVVRWDDGTPVFKAISSIDKVAPAAINVVGHGIPEGWPVAIVSVKGMTQINTPNPERVSDYTPASVVDVDNIILPYIDASSYKNYTSGGYVRYRKPVDLTGYTARMKIKRNKSDDTELVYLTDGNGITIDNTDKTIQIVIDATITETLDFNSGVYDLELVSATSEVFRILEGSVTVSRETTT